MSETKNNAKPPQTSLILRLLGGGYLVYLAWDLARDNLGLNLFTAAAVVFGLVGGALFIGMAINLLGLRQEKIKVGDMLPAIFLPILYFPLAELVSGLF